MLEKFEKFKIENLQLILGGEKRETATAEEEPE
jgi:hypothetical protein